MQIVFPSDSDAKELCWHMKEVKDRKGLLAQSRHDALSKDRFLKETLRRESECSASSALLYKRSRSHCFRRESVFKQSQFHF